MREIAALQTVLKDYGGLLFNRRDVKIAAMPVYGLLSDCAGRTQLNNVMRTVGYTYARRSRAHSSWSRLPEAYGLLAEGAFSSSVGSGSGLHRFRVTSSQ